MNEIEVKKAAKKIQAAQTFQDLHDIMLAYANLYKSQESQEYKDPKSDTDYRLPSSIAEKAAAIEKIQKAASGRYKFTGKTEMELDYEKLCNLTPKIEEYFPEPFDWDDSTFDLNKDGEKI